MLGAHCVYLFDVRCLMFDAKATTSLSHQPIRVTEARPSSDGHAIRRHSSNIEHRTSNINRSFAKVYLWLLIGISGITATFTTNAERIKDITSIAGVRTNQLVGYGLVVGLAGTGDQTTQSPFTVQSLKNMLTQLGVAVPPNVNPQLKNAAAVMIHADLPPFAKLGQTIDITVSSVSNAKSLRGGSLLMAPLKGADGKVYAIAQGNLVVGGFGAEGSDGSSVTVNIPSAGRIPNGATVERTVPNAFASTEGIMLNLNTPDFTTAQRMAAAVNATLGPGLAQPLDSASVMVKAPLDPVRKVAFLSELENLDVQPGDAAARVVINARTGTIVMGSYVKVLPSAVSHGSLTVTISENPEVSQPAPFSRGGSTAVVPDSAVGIEEDSSRMFLFDPGVTLEELVRAVNSVGVAPGDLVAILEALRMSGSLRAELVVI